MKHARLCAVLAAIPFLAHAQQLPMDEPLPSADLFRGVIGYVGEQQNGWMVCLGPAHSVDTVQPAVQAELQRRGVQSLPTPNQVVDAMAARYPCPFTPYRAGLRPAEAKDVQGTWASPEGSMKLLFPPKSPAWKAEAATSLKCEAVGYFPEGEARTIELRGKTATCPPKAAEFAATRALPRVMTWSVPRPGRLVHARADPAAQADEWEVFVVETAFDFVGVSFRPGDLIAYLRKTPGVARSYAVRFRHLRKLR